MYRAVRNPSVSSSSSKSSRAIVRAAAAAALEPLEGRRLFAVTASFTGGVLTVLGDNNPNAITVSRDAAGNLRVNNGAVLIGGGTATIANTTLIKVIGSGGNDSLALDETNGVLPK